MEITSPPSSDHETQDPTIEQNQKELQGLREHTEFFKNNMQIPDNIHANSFRNLIANHQNSEFRHQTATVHQNNQFLENSKDIDYGFPNNNGMRVSEFRERKTEKEMKTAPVNGFEPASIVRKVDIGQKISDLENFERNIKWGKETNKNDSDEYIHSNFYFYNFKKNLDLFIYDFRLI